MVLNLDSFALFRHIICRAFGLHPTDSNWHKHELLLLQLRALRFLLLLRIVLLLAIVRINDHGLVHLKILVRLIRVFILVQVNGIYSRPHQICPIKYETFDTLFEINLEW